MAATSPAKSTRKAAEKSSGPDPATLLGFYREMLLIRRFEEKAGQLYAGRFRRSCGRHGPLPRA